MIVTWPHHNINLATLPLGQWVPVAAQVLTHHDQLTDYGPSALVWRVCDELCIVMEDKGSAEHRCWAVLDATSIVASGSFSAHDATAAVLKFACESKLKSSLSLPSTYSL
jgi:hypothetical protein